MNKEISNFALWIEEINNAVQEIKRDNLIELGDTPGKTLMNLCEKHRMSISELMELLRSPKQ